MAQQYKIQGGPGKWEIMLSLFDGQSVVFHLAGTSVIEMSVKLSRVEREDGSGESWNLGGWMTEVGDYRHFNAYYSTRSRHGDLTVLEV